MKNRFFIFSIRLFLLWITILGAPNIAFSSTLDSSFLSTDSLTSISDSTGNDSTSDVSFRISKDAIEELIDYKANDSIVFDMKNKMVYLYGGAKVLYGDMNLEAWIIAINFETKELKAIGKTDSMGKYEDKPKFKDASREVIADSMRYNFASKKGKMQGLRLQEGEGYIICNKVYREESGVILTDIGKYTTCNEEHPHFYLNARKLKIIPNDKIIFGPANIVIEDIPLPAFLPFGLFPTKKGQQAGLIIPQYGLSPNRGYNFTNLGYYFPLSDYMDQSVLVDFYFRGSWGLKSNTRYAKKYKYNGALNLGYSYNIIGEEGTSSYFVSPDYKIRWVHTQDAKAKPGTGFNADVDIQSSTYNQFNSFNPNQIVASQFASTVSYSKMLKGGKHSMRLGMNHRQNTQTKEFNVDLPNFNYDVSRFTPFALKNRVGRPKWYETIGVSYSANFRNNLRTFDSLLLDPKVVDDFSNGILHTVPISTSFKVFKNYFTLNPSINYSEYWYFKTIRKQFNESTKQVETNSVNGFSRASNFSTSLSLTTRIFGTVKFAKSQKIQAIRHVITPNLSVSFRPDFSEQPFNYFREVQLDSTGRIGKYSIFEGAIHGGPGSGKQGIVNFNLMNNLEMKRILKTDTSTKFNIVKLIEALDINTNYNFLADSFNLSDIRMTMRTVLFGKLSVQMNATLDPYSRIDNRRINAFALSENNKLGTWSGASFVTSYSLNPQALPKFNSVSRIPGAMLSDDEWRNIALYPHTFVDFNVPWNFSFNYSLSYKNPFNSIVSSTNNIVSFSGDLKLTENWKIDLSSGYDFAQKQISFTSVNFTRDLHCWQINFNWFPIGIRKSFVFTIRAKSSLLQDLKLNKRGFWFDGI